LKTNPAAGQLYTIAVGGSDVDTVVYQEVIPVAKPADTGFSVSGTVLNAADDIGEESYNEAWVTTVNLKPTVLSEIILTSTIVDMTEKTFELSYETAGSYVVEVIRDGYVPRYFNVVLDSASEVAVGDKSLFAGDIEFDYAINGLDSETLFAYFGLTYEDNDYRTTYDLTADGSLNGLDTESLFANFGEQYDTYGEIGVDFDN
jgi:hypothetical protein